MLRRLLSLIKQPKTDATNAQQRYLRASLGMILSGSGADQRAHYAAVTAIKRYRSWIYAAASINAFGVSSVPLRLYVRSGQAGKLFRTGKVNRDRKGYLLGNGQRTPSRTVMSKMHDFGAEFEEVTEAHPVLDLLRKVNPQMNGFDLAATRTLWQELTGNAYLHVIKNQLGVPSELWPMPPQWVEIVPSETEFIAEYKYGKDSNTKVSIAPDEVLHFKRPNPESLFYGMGKVEAAWGVADLNDANHEMDIAMARNRARPDYLATIQNTDASEDAIAEFERAVNEKLKGPEKQGGFIALTGQVDLKPMQFAPKDLAGRDEIVEEIAAVFGVPVSMLKANDPNLASATTGFAQWRESTILPLLRLDEETLNQKLLPMFGIENDAVLAYDDPVPANRQLDLQEHTGLVAAGVMTINEVREARGLDALDIEEAQYPMVNGQSLAPLDLTDLEPQPEPQQPPMPPVAEPAAEAVPEPPPPVKSKATTQGAPERYSGIDFTPTEGMAEAAERGLRLRAEFNRGGTEVGVARATQLKNREVLSPETVRRMHSFFSRHASDKRPGWDDPSDPSAGFVAHLLWGGDAGKDWSERVTARMDRADDEDKGIEAKDALAECVAEKISLLLAEGYDRDQAIAIAYEKCGEKSAKSCGCCSESKSKKHIITQSELLDETVMLTKSKARDRIEEKVVRRLEREIGRLNRRQMDAVLKAITKSGLPEDMLLSEAKKALQDDLLDYIETQVSVKVAPYLKESLGIGFANGKDGVEDAIRRSVGGELPRSISFDETPATDWSRTRAVELVDELGKTTQVKVATVLSELVDEGATIDEMADELETRGFDPGRARRIARTETTRAMNRGQIDAWKQSEVVTGKKWLASPEACPFCEQLERSGETKAMDQDFLQVGDSVTAEGKTLVVDYDAVTGPPLHPNCRCSLVPVLESDK
jgi:HK97 family phage portal protein